MACTALITSFIPLKAVNSSYRRDLHVLETALDPVRLLLV